MNNQSDVNLLQRWGQGDVGAFGDLFEKHSGRLFTLAYRLTGNHEDAHDLVQDSALKAFSSGARCEQAAAFHGWIRRILMNLFLDNLRYHSRAGRDSLDSRVAWEEIEEHSPATSILSPRAEIEREEEARAVEGALHLDAIKGRGFHNRLPPAGCGSGFRNSPPRR
jgi:RNA polymerase sigma-70 factor (ECF subfamily)